MSSIQPTSAKIRELLQDNYTGLFDEVSQTSVEGNQTFNTLLHSDNILSSPICFRTGPIPASTSTLSASTAANAVEIPSSPPELLSSPDLTREEKISIHHRFCLEDGTRELIRWHPKERRLELAHQYFLKVQGDESLRAIAELYDVCRTTLMDRINGRKSRKESGLAQQKLLIAEQLSLISYITFLYELGIPASLTKATEMAQEILQRRYARTRGLHVRQLDNQILPQEFRVGSKWMRRFINRRPELEMKLAKTLESKRAIQTCRQVAEDFLKKFSFLVKKYNIEDSNIWNMDETGYMLGSAKGAPATKVVVPSRDKRANTRTGSDSREWVSVIECVSVDGKCMPPYFILKGAHLLNRHCHQLDQWYPDGWNYGHSPNGWTDDEHALKWLEWFEERTRPEEFKRSQRVDRIQDDGINYRIGQRNGTLVWTEGVEPANYRLLLFDGHASHLSGEFVAYALQHKIVLCCLPPHTSHYLQPLDVGVFTHAKRRYRVAVQERADRGWATMKRDHFLPLYAGLRPNNLNTLTIMDGWKQTGIRPVSVDVLERHFKDQNNNLAARKLQTLQPDQLQQQNSRLDEGLCVQITGISTTQPAESGTSLFLAHGRAESINPHADYHDICAQILVENEPERLNILVQSLQSWCERKELEAKLFKLTANLFYESSVQNKKTSAETSSRSHLGLCQTIDQDSWRARQERLQKQEEEAQRRKAAKAATKEKERLDKIAAREETKLAKAAITAQKRAAKAAARPTTKRRRLTGPSQLSQSFTPACLDPRLRDNTLERLVSPSLASIASLGLGALSEVESLALEVAED
jgi:hypothetical protein